jgi:hypothetical protein
VFLKIDIDKFKENIALGLKLEYYDILPTQFIEALESISSDIEDDNNLNLSNEYTVEILNAPLSNKKKDKSFLLNESKIKISSNNLILSLIFEIQRFYII